MRRRSKWRGWHLTKEPQEFQCLFCSGIAPLPIAHSNSRAVQIRTSLHIYGFAAHVGNRTLLTLGHVSCK
eukprot:6553221-Alexandrium_andersonii.AAC.1